MVFLNSVSCSSKLIEPEEGVIGTSNLLSISQKHRSGRLKWVSREQCCETAPLTCEIWPYLQVGSVRIELNCRTSASVSQVAGVEKKFPHVWCQKHYECDSSVRIKKRHIGGRVGFPYLIPHTIMITNIIKLAEHQPSIDLNDIDSYVYVFIIIYTLRNTHSYLCEHLMPSWSLKHIVLPLFGTWNIWSPGSGRFTISNILLSNSYIKPGWK